MSGGKTNNSVIAINIPKRKHTSLIGKGGGVVRDLQANFNVKINIPARDDPSTEVLLTGKADDIQKVRAEMEKLGIRTSTEPLVELELEIAPADYKIIIGRGGETLRSIESRFSVSVNVPKQGDTSPYVVIEGSNEAVHDALGEIKNLLRSDVKVRNTKGVEPPPAAPSPSPTPAHAHGAKAQSAGTPQSVAPQAVPAPTGKGGDVINKVLFFPDKDPLHNHNFDEFLATIHSARSTLDICVFTVTDDRIATTILSRAAANVKVRIITDNDQSVMLGSDIVRLKESGIPVKMDISPFHMHHKFAVIDNSMLINGSFNWTRGASRDNCENVMITNNKEFVSQFHTHFEKMWSDNVNFK